jgi:hypothetical protein
MLCNEMLMMALNVSRFFTDDDPLRRLLPAGHYLRDYQGSAFVEHLETWVVAAGSTEGFWVRGQTVRCWELALNTAIVNGSDPIYMMARLNGQCEVHGYVPERERAWFAATIEQGLENGICRSKMGWENVLALMLAPDRGPIVTSYSVTESFPNMRAAGKNWKPPDGLEGIDEIREAWYEMSFEDQWRLATKGLSGNKFLAIRKDPRREFRFTHRMTGYDVRNYANRLRPEDNPAIFDLK